MTEVVTPSRDICVRTYKFSVRVLRMVRKLPKDVGAQIVARQLARSGTGIGSNVEEAQSAQSRVEFARKMNIALSEAREAHYWLRLAGEAGITKQDLTAAITQKAYELVSILTVVVKRTRARKQETIESK